MSIRPFDLGTCKRKRILVESSPGIWRYIAKIIPYGKSDGGFAFVPSYEHNETGIMAIQALDTFSHLIKPADPTIVDYQKANNRIKISYHPDGATQISGAGETGTIRSGREKKTGEFKGMGILAHPFSAPTYSGGILGMTSWGLVHYPRTSIVKDTILFHRNDFQRKSLLSKGCVYLEIFAISRREKMDFYKHDDEIRCRSIRWNGTLGLREKMDLRVFNLRTDEMYLGIRCFARQPPSENGYPSGYMMSTQRGRNDQVGLMVFCPPHRKNPNVRSLDRGLLRPKIIMPLGRQID